MQKPLSLALLVMLGMYPAAAETESQQVLAGFTQESSVRQRRLEEDLHASLSLQRIEDHLRWLTSRPHLPGSEVTREIAEYLHKELETYGFATTTTRYEGYLPAPVAVAVELLEPTAETLPTTEDPIAGDPFTNTVAEHPGWSGYSPSGEATGQVVYGHYGSEGDLQRLVDLGIQLDGKILLLRNFGTGEGRKVRNAQRFGAAGVLLYTDPAEDGFPFGDTYPDGNWRPAGSIMRRSILFLPYDGDPLSPGWASLPGAKRLRPDEVALPAIPTLPVSYATAERILSLLGGPTAPTTWQGALPVTYRTGPGPAKVRLKTEMDNRDRPMLNVVGRLEGASEPDQWILVGNHHDAWIYGAGDPSSGTAALLELARVLGDMARQGRRPRRTVIIAFWDAEEMSYGGSTEWVEHHAPDLLDKAIACINMDSAVFNPERPLSVAAHPVLHELFREVARDVADPHSGRSTYEVWRDLQNRFRQVPGVDGWGEFFDPARELSEPRLFEVPYDDAAPFYNYLALPASDMYYGADYGMYHSIYENFHWMKTVVDPTFEYHRVMAEMQGFVALRLANADLLPLDFANEARFWRLAYNDLAAVARDRGQEIPELAKALQLIDRWQSEAEALRAEFDSVLETAERFGGGEDQLNNLNRRLSYLNRDFFRPEGRPGAFAERNLFAGSSYEFEGVSGSTLPGIRFALDRDDLQTARREALVYLTALQRRVSGLQEIRALVDLTLDPSE